MGGGASSAKGLARVTAEKIENCQPGSYWRPLGKFMRTHFPNSSLVTEDVRAVLVFLRVGNLTTADGSVRSYTDNELKVIGETLSSSRSRVSKFVETVIKILVRTKVTTMTSTSSSSRGLISSGREDSNGSTNIEADSKKKGVLTAAHEQLLVKCLKSLVGNKTWDMNAQDPEMYKFVHQQALVKLKAIAAFGENTIFPKIRDKFADIAVPKHQHRRLDDRGVLPVTALKDILHMRSVGGLATHSFEVMVLFEYLAKLIDPFFQAAARNIAAHTNGLWRAAPPKTCVRMSAKLGEDHKAEREPKAAANIDMSR